MDQMQAIAIYQPGTIIRARHRLWRIDRQEQDVLIATTIDGGQTEQHHLYLGRDFAGNPFEHITREQLHPPDTRYQGNPAMQQLLQRAYRLSLLHGSAPLLSLQRSRVIPTDYQLVPVAMALESPRVRLALFDDVGLGKTIEAGLIITELMARQLASRVLLICPANLREQWREALAYFFHLDARIISQRHRREMERQLAQDANPWEFFSTLIVSEDYAKQPQIRQEIRNQQWDIVLFDEAHTVAKPHQSSPDATVDMERWELARMVALSPQVRHLLLLTATPHNGHTDSFASLLRLLDVGAVIGPDYAPQINREIARAHVCQRTRKDITAWFERDGKPSPLPKRDQFDNSVSTNEKEKDVFEAVQQYTTAIREAAVGTRYDHIAEWTVMHLYKRALSSPQALMHSLQNRRAALKTRAKQFDLDSNTTPPLDQLAITDAIARANVFDDAPSERFTEEETGHRVERSVFEHTTTNNIETELAYIKTIEDLLKLVTPAKDSKLQSALSKLQYMLRRHPRVIIFTRYRDTMNYIAEQLTKSERYRDTHVVCIDGTMSEQQRKEAFEEFRVFGTAKSKRVKSILVATDAISEGINLQELACQMIHWELPWNPNRLEQRVGRIDRFGQPEPTVYVELLVLQDTFEAKILKVLVEKVARIREEYGFSPPYFGDQMTILDMMREQNIPIFLGHEQSRMFVDPTPPPKIDRNPLTNEVIETMRSESFYGATDITIPAIEARRRQTDETLGSPAAIQQFVRTALTTFGASLHDYVDGPYRGTFKVTLHHPDLLVEGVANHIDFATFDPEAALLDPQQTLLDLGHPLVRRLLDLVKERTFLADKDYGRTAAYRLTGLDRTTAVVHVLARFVVGTTPPSLIEELLPIAFPLFNTDHTAAIPLTSDKTTALLALPPDSTAVNAMDALDDLTQALTVSTAYIEHAVAEQRQRLGTERHRLLTEAHLADRQTDHWLSGIDDITTASYDLLTISVFYPAL